MLFNQLIQKALREASLEVKHPKSYRLHANHFDDLWGGLTVEEVTPALVEQWKLHRLKKVSPATVRHQMAFLSRVFRIAQRDGILASSPLTHIRKPRVHHDRCRVLHPQEEGRMESTMSAKPFSVVKFALLTGLRRLELFSLRPADLELNWIYVRKAKVKPRRVPLNEEALAIFETWASFVGGEYVFYPDANPNRVACGDWFLRYKFYPGIKGANVHDLTFRDLRHTAASRMVQRGVPLLRVARILGHSNMKQTMRYAHLQDHDLMDAVQNTRTPKEGEDHER